AAIAARVADQSEADAGVAGGALDHHAAGLEHAARLGVLDDAKPRAVLHRAPGVHELGLAEDGAAGCLRGAAEFYQWRVADRGGEVRAGAVAEIGCAHACPPSRVPG